MRAARCSSLSISVKPKNTKYFIFGISSAIMQLLFLHVSPPEVMNIKSQAELNTHTHTRAG